MREHYDFTTAQKNPYLYWDVKIVRPLENHCLYVELVNGKCGIFDVKPYLNHGVFNKLKDLAYFNQVAIKYGALTWPHEQDIAPETLIAEMTPTPENLA